MLDAFLKSAMVGILFLIFLTLLKMMTILERIAGTLPLMGIFR